MSGVTKVALVFAVLLLAGVGIYFWPMLLFWAIRTLFGVAIPFTLKTWAAAWVLMLAFNAGGGRSGSQ